MEATLKYAEHKLDEAIRQGEPDETIAYWRGYRDCAKAMDREAVRIDLEAWKCPYCTPDSEGYVRKFGAFSIHNGFLGTGHCKPAEIKYCPECARPLNGASAAELEKRLKGLWHEQV